MIANANFCPNPAYSPAFFLRRIGIVKTLRLIFKTWFDVAGAPRSTTLSRSRITSRFVMSAAFLLPRNRKESWRRAPRQFATTLNTSCIFPACCDTMLLFWTQRFRTGERNQRTDFSITQMDGLYGQEVMGCRYGEALCAADYF